tara:strand:- start:536 stop:1273 length:738 start_codon:yes stop_codon:yes gene_type:complete
MKICIIITATIDPKGMVFTERNSPKDRLNDYKKAFREFCNQKEVSNIIFVENSGYSLDYFQNEKKNYPDKKIEIMSSKINNEFSRKLGKGFGEHLSLREVFDKSVSLKDYDYFIKCTGRHHLLNFSSIFKSIKKEISTVNGYLKDNLKFFDTTVLCGSKDFFINYVIPETKNVNDSENIFFENCVANALLKGMADGYSFNQIEDLPIIEGYSGTNNKKFRHNIVRRIKIKILGKLKHYLISHKKY